MEEDVAGWRAGWGRLRVGDGARPRRELRPACFQWSGTVDPHGRDSTEKRFCKVRWRWQRLRQSGSRLSTATSICLTRRGRQGAPYSGGGRNTLPALPARYRKLATPLGIVGAIEVEASPWIEDNLWVLEVEQGERMMLGDGGQSAAGEARVCGIPGAVSQERVVSGNPVRELMGI